MTIVVSTLHALIQFAQFHACVHACMHMHLASYDSIYTSKAVGHQIIKRSMDTVSVPQTAYRKMRTGLADWTQQNCL